MLTQGILQNLEEYFSDLDARTGKAVFFYRINGWNEEIGVFLKKYYEAARQTGVVLDGKIPNPDRQNLAYFESILGTDFELSMGFLENRLKKWLPRLDEKRRRILAAVLYDTLDGSNHQTNEKIGFGYPELVPVLAIVDPELMKTVPPKYTAYQGFDALFHNTEVMISNGINILSETIALSAIEHIAKYLPRAVANGEDLEAREAVAYGSTIAGITMQLTCTTAQHSMEHAMSAYHHNLPHGAGLIMISKAFAEFFIEKHACDKQFIKMAKVMGIPNADKPEDFITALVKLQKDCGVDNLKMSDYGFTPDEFMTLAVNARETMGGLFLANPCPMSDEECAGIFDKSYR